QQRLPVYAYMRAGEHQREAKSHDTNLERAEASFNPRARMNLADRGRKNALAVGLELGTAVRVTHVEYALLALSSLFVIIDPIATVPAFLAMTPSDTPEHRVQMARIACQTAAVLLLAFALGGHWVFRFLGITIPALQMAGSVILLLIALDMLKAERSKAQETHEEVEAGAAKADIAITPLAIPMLAGPGAISTVILLQAKADNLAKHFLLYASIAVVCTASYLVFSLSARGAKWLSPIVLRVTTRVMGLVLAAIAMQFLLNALRELKLVSFGDG
ncbi:MAG TPA: MarC family protein, partial [Verrucomicrobiota bacterium]|nr:MarC family protein [Verrucomicrobiota bacterium]